MQRLAANSAQGQYRDDRPPLRIKVNEDSASLKEINTSAAGRYIGRVKYWLRVAWWQHARQSREKT